MGYNIAQKFKKKKDRNASNIKRNHHGSPEDGQYIAQK